MTKVTSIDGHDIEFPKEHALHNALVDAVCNLGEGMSLSSIVGVLELVKLNTIDNHMEQE